jgi:hypothetical protein
MAGIPRFIGASENAADLARQIEAKTTSKQYLFDSHCSVSLILQANRLGKWALGELNIYEDSFFNHAGNYTVL